MARAPQGNAAAAQGRAPQSAARPSQPAPQARPAKPTAVPDLKPSSAAETPSDKLTGVANAQSKGGVAHAWGLFKPPGSKPNGKVSH